MPDCIHTNWKRPWILFGTDFELPRSVLLICQYLKLAHDFEKIPASPQESIYSSLLDSR